MKKRIIAALAAVVMLCAVPFAGCGGRSETGGGRQAGDGTEL